MDKKSKIFLYCFFVVLLGILAVSFWKFYIKEDFYITQETDCDPEKEACFVYECDPTTDDSCPAVEADRISYYKLIEKKAFSLAGYDPSASDAEPLICQNGEDCREILCNDDTKVEGDVCNDPAVFLRNAENNELNESEDQASSPVEENTDNQNI